MTKNVLITGTSSHQYSQKTAERNCSFAHVLSKALQHTGHGVEIDRPFVTTDQKAFDDYDHVFVGISPFMSVTANGAYGALSTIGTLADTGKLTLFSDVPEPWKFFANLKSIEKDTDQLFKPFYKRRLDYAAATSLPKNRKNITKAIDILGTAIPPVIYPALPWSGRDDKNLPSVPDYAVDMFFPVMPDIFISEQPMKYSETRLNSWIVDTKAKWARDAAQTLMQPCIDFSLIKGDLARLMNTSLGVLVGSHGDGETWWSPRYMQAINASVPIVTDWRRSRSLGPSWSHLPGTVETMSSVQLYETMLGQRHSYIGALPSKDEAAEDVLVTARIL